MPYIITNLNSFIYVPHWTLTGISFAGSSPKVFQQHLQIILKNSYMNKAQKYKAIKAGEKYFLENNIKVK